MTYSKSKVFTWSLYDFANTIFSMNVVTLNFPLFIKNNYHGADLSIALARSSAMVLVALSMPIAGVVADKFQRRMPLTILFTIFCCATTAMLGKGGSIYLQLILFALAVYSYESGLVFYNAVLPQIAPPDRIGRISGYGVAFGYCGTIFGLSVIGAVTGLRAYSSAFTWTGILFILFSLPFFLTVKDDAARPFINFWGMTVDSVRNISKVFIDAKSRPGILRFFLARFFIVEALETIILFMGIFLVQAIGFSDNEALIGNLSEVTVFLLAVTVFTVIGSLCWGYVAEKFGPRNSLLGTVVLSVVTLIGILFISSKPIFYLLGSLAGISLGGVWTTERPLLINLVADNKRLAEYFGLFALAGRTAAVVGPVIWGLIVMAFGFMGPSKYRIAVGSVLLMMTIGLIILRKVPDAR